MPNFKISKAYPNYDEYMPTQPRRDTDKWIAIAKEIYYQVHKGESKNKVLEKITAGWDNMEKLDFKKWLKFYEEGSHNKYSEASEKPIQIKVGQVGYWEDSNRAGYFVPVNKQPEPAGQSIDFAKNPETNEGLKQDSKREIIESQRNKIVSRLDSAEKLLRSNDGQIFAGKEFEALMHIIYELKKKIHTVNKISTSTRLYEDMIIREANILTKNGFRKASDVLHKIAQEVPLITPTEPENPISGDGLTGEAFTAGPAGSNPIPAPPSPMPGMPPAGPVLAPEEKPSEGMSGFLDGLAGKKNTSEVSNTDDLNVEEDVGNAWVVEAQVAPEAAAPVTPKDDGLEVQENPVATEVVTEVTNPFDKKMDQLFNTVKIEDVVQKLEDLTKVYKTREMPRQLSVIDMMLDHLGLASFFPTLAEATNRALDSNQYILTRLEDIASRLRGTVQTNSIDLKGQSPIPSSPELDASRNQLQEEQDKEKARKKMKKEQELAEVNPSKPEPSLEVEEDLGGPINTPAPTAPAAPQAAPVK